MMDSKTQLALVFEQADKMLEIIESMTDEGRLHAISRKLGENYNRFLTIIRNNDDDADLYIPPYVFTDDGKEGDDNEQSVRYVDMAILLWNLKLFMAQLPDETGT